MLHIDGFGKISPSCPSAATLRLVTGTIHDRAALVQRNDEVLSFSSPYPEPGDPMMRERIRVQHARKVGRAA